MIAAFADGALTPRASDAFDAHLAECAACRAPVRELPAARPPAASSTGDDGRERATILRPGDTFGRYTITAWLGRGGMGQVYRARDALLARDLALKLLPPDGEIADAGGRLLRKARAAATLAHPNVVTIFDVGEHDGVRYIAMELVVGQTCARDSPQVRCRCASSRISSSASRALSPRRTRGGSCIAISSPRTSCCATMAS